MTNILQLDNKNNQNLDTKVFIRKVSQVGCNIHKNIIFLPKNPCIHCEIWYYVYEQEEDSWRLSETITIKS